MALQSTEGRGQWPCTEGRVSLQALAVLSGRSDSRAASGPGPSLRNVPCCCPFTGTLFTGGSPCLVGAVSAHRGRQGWPDFKLSVLTPGLSPDAWRLGWVGARAFLAASLSACGQRGRTFPKPHRCEELVAVVFAWPY